MPVATLRRGARRRRRRSCVALGAQILLANTYHLHERPGEDVVAERRRPRTASRGWRGPVAHRQRRLPGHLARRPRAASTRKASRSPRRSTAARRLLTPEGAVAIQEALGADVAMVLDECVRRAGVERARRAIASRDGADAPLGRALRSARAGAPTRRSSGSCRAAPTRALRRAQRARDSRRSASTATRTAGSGSARPARARGELVAEAHAALPAERAALPDGPRPARGPRRGRSRAASTSSTAWCRRATRATACSSRAAGSLAIRNARFARRPATRSTPPATARPAAATRAATCATCSRWATCSARASRRSTTCASTSRLLERARARDRGGRASAHSAPRWRKPRARASRSTSGRARVAAGARTASRAQGFSAQAHPAARRSLKPLREGSMRSAARPVRDGIHARAWPSRPRSAVLAAGGAVALYAWLDSAALALVWGVARRGRGGLRALACASGRLAARADALEDVVQRFAAGELRGVDGAARGSARKLRPPAPRADRPRASAERGAAERLSERARRSCPSAHRPRERGGRPTSRGAIEETVEETASLLANINTSIRGINGEVESLAALHRGGLVLDPRDEARRSTRWRAAPASLHDVRRRVARASIHEISAQHPPGRRERRRGAGHGRGVGRRDGRRWTAPSRRSSEHVREASGLTEQVSARRGGRLAGGRRHDRRHRGDPRARRAEARKAVLERLAEPHRRDRRDRERDRRHQRRDQPALAERRDHRRAGRRAGQGLRGGGEPREDAGAAHGRQHEGDRGADRRGAGGVEQRRARDGRRHGGRRVGRRALAPRRRGARRRSASSSREASVARRRDRARRRRAEPQLEARGRGRAEHLVDGAADQRRR